MPSPLPIEPSFSLVVALTPTRSIDSPAMSAIRARIASRCGPTFGASHTIVTSRWRCAAARLHALDRKGKETVGGGAAPLLIAGRKMHADVAVSERAEDRVDQRMQGHVGVGMTVTLRACGIRTPPSKT